MEVPNRKYTLGSFYSWLEESAKNYSAILKLVCLLTTFKSWESPNDVLTLRRLFERRDFSVREMGEIRELSTSYTDPETEKIIPVRFYCHLSSDEPILRCFTTARSEDVRRVLSPVTNQPGIYHLWINPQAFDEVRNSILSSPGASSTFFAASRFSSMNPTGKIRPAVERTVMYHGEDAEETLQEMTYQYGVTPDTIKFHVPGLGDLQINSQGIFTYFGGDFDFLVKISDLAIKLSMKTKKIIDSSRIEVLELKTARKSLEIRQLVPWLIELERSLEPEALELLFQQLQASKFAVYNSVIMKGSLHAEGTVLDEMKRTVFTLTVDNHHISVSPRYDSSFESFFRFYETIVNRFDSGARCVTPAEAKIG